MRYSQEEVSETFKRLGVKRWDTSPPENGVIQWFDESGRRVASGRYQVILSYGPGEEYTMGWAIAIYKTIGVPVVPRASEDEIAKRDASLEAAYEHARHVGDRVGADFTYRCATIFVAVFD